MQRLNNFLAQIYVLETKTWRGTVEGRAGDRNWTLRRPKGRDAITLYNPLMQNDTHAKVIGAITHAQVTPLIVSAAHVRVSPELADRVLPLAGLTAHLGPPGPATGRVQAAYDGLIRRRDSLGQRRLADRHKRWMIANRRFDPVKALWVACAVSLACALITAQRIFAG